MARHRLQISRDDSDPVWGQRTRRRRGDEGRVTRKNRGPEQRDRPRSRIAN